MESNTHSLNDLTITSGSAHGGTFCVRVGHPLLGQPIEFEPDGATMLAMRLVVGAEVARKGHEADLRVWEPGEEDLQALVKVQAFQAIDGQACVELRIGAMQIRMDARGAVHLGVRLAYAAELAQQKIDHAITSGLLSDPHIKAAHFYLMAMGARMGAWAVGADEENQT